MIFPLVAATILLRVDSAFLGPDERLTLEWAAQADPETVCIPPPVIGPALLETWRHIIQVRYTAMVVISDCTFTDHDWFLRANNSRASCSMAGKSAWPCV